MSKDKSAKPKTKLLYHRLMLPNWLRNNEKWTCPYEGDDLNLIIKADSSDWENIFRVPLIPSGCLMKISR